MKHVIMWLLCVFAGGALAAGEHITPDNQGGYFTQEGRYQSDRMGGYYAPREHIQSDGRGGYITKQGNVKPDNLGGFYAPDGHYQSDGRGGYITPDGKFVRPDGMGSWYINK